MPKPKVTLTLTVLEADMLSLVAGNGWGDGDFAEWLGDHDSVKACQRALRKLKAARDKAKAMRSAKPE